MILEALQIPLTAAYLYLAADVVTCEVQTSPRIHVRPIAKPVKYNHRRTVQELTDSGTDTISPYNKDIPIITGGLAESQVDMDGNIELYIDEHPSHGLSCFYYDKINIVIELDSTIYIAKDYGLSSCEYHEVLEHEKKHVEADRRIVNEYAKKIGEVLRTSVNLSMVRGPYPSSRKDAIQNDMLEYVENILAVQQSLMNEERFRAQQAVDSFEEYERVRKACETRNSSGRFGG